MAEHGCDANTAAPDWEILSMSMSASTFGDPNPVAKTVEDAAPESFFRYPSPSPSVIDNAKGTNPFHESSGDGEVADGHKPHSPPAHLHECGAGHGYGEEDMCFPDQNVKSPLQKDPSMAASLHQEREPIEESLPGVSVKNSPDQAPKKKARRSRSSKAIWTVAIAATIVGIVMLGRCLQAELHRNQQLQVELSVKDEELKNVTFQVNRLKEVLSKHHTLRSSSF